MLPCNRPRNLWQHTHWLEGALAPITTPRECERGRRETTRRIRLRWGVTLVIKVRESADSDLPEKGSEDGNPPPFLSGKTSDSILGHNDLVATHRSDQTTVDDELCATFDESTQCTIVCFFAREGSRVLASCSVPRLRVRRVGFA